MKKRVKTGSSKKWPGLLPAIFICDALSYRRGGAVPGGAHPSYAHGYYARDNAYYKAWDAIARERDTWINITNIQLC